MEEKNNIAINVSGCEQINIALDKAHIEAQQNNRFELEEVVQEVLEVLKGNEIFENKKEDCRIATEEDVKDFPNEMIEEYKKQLGTRLVGNEGKLQIISMMLKEMEDTLQVKKRYGVMPIFSYIPRGTVWGYVSLDDCVMPFDKVEIQEYYWDAYEKYVIENKYYHFMVVMHDGQTVYIELGYTLCFTDVTDRLYGFGKVKRLSNAKKMELILLNTNRKIQVDMLLLGEDREKHIAVTDYWIEQMEMIDAIEKHFQIKFHLPKKASEEDYQAICVLYNAINKFQTSTFPPLPMKRELFRKAFKVEEILINDGTSFLPLDLFGYHFQPVAAYLMECTLIWKKKIKAWEVKEGGVPVRVEFICCSV